MTVVTVLRAYISRPADSGHGRRARRDRLVGRRHRPGRRGRHRHRGHRGDQADHHRQQHPDALSPAFGWIPVHGAAGHDVAARRDGIDSLPRRSRPGCPAGRSHRAARHRGDAGLAEFVVCLPVFFLLVIGGIQYALWSHASHLARAAAEQGSQVASGYGSTPAAGTERGPELHRHHRSRHLDQSTGCPPAPSRAMWPR